ncbi:MAG: hypothetical protein ACXVLX_20310, partial [Ilumatobacteraceae bacterium]
GLDFDASARILPPRSQTSIAGAESGRRRPIRRSRRRTIERQALVDSEPHKFMLPEAGDMRYNWVVVCLAEIDHAEMTELVVDAWRMVVPKKVFNAYQTQQEHGVQDR